MGSVGRRALGRIGAVVLLLASTVVVTGAVLTATAPAAAAIDPAAVYRAVNLNGAAIVAGGVSYEAGTAANVTAGPNTFCNQGVALVPATDAATATMVRCSVWGTSANGAWVTMSSVPSGSYLVSLHAWEDNLSQTFSVAINGATVASNQVSGSPGAWKVLGPFPVTVTNGSIAVTTSGGDVNLSSIVVEASGAPVANRAPLVTSPGNQSSLRGAAIAPLAISASDPDAGQSLTWSQVGLPAGLVMNPSTGQVSGTPTTSGVSSVTVTVTDSGVPALAASTTFTWTVSESGTSTVYRAVNLNGAAIVAGGVSYEAGTAANVTAGPNTFCNQGVTLVPATDAATATMVRCSVWGTSANGARVTMSSVPSGSYLVSLHAWEDNLSQTFSVAINGATVASNQVSGSPGAWKVLGPFPVTVTNGSIAVTTSGGDVNLSSIVVANAGPAPTATVSITAPAAGAVVTPPATISGAAADPSGVDHVHLRIVDGATGQFWNGTSFQSAPAEVSPTMASPGAPSTTWSFVFAPPSSSTQAYQLTATSHGVGGSESTPYASSFRLATGGGGGGGGTFDPTKVTDTFVAGGNWTNSLAADWLPNGHLLVLTQRGVIYDVNPATQTQTVALDITSKVFSQGEAGALDILVDGTGTGFYVYYSVAGSDRLRISHFTLGSSVEQVIWNNPGLGYNTSNPFHIGATMNVGPDGKLYVGIGDRVEARSKDLTNVFGKMLRINLDGTVPTDNPFYDGAGSNVDEIWAYGLRNPYRGNFDAATGRFWVGDVGGNNSSTAYEEVNIIERGANYGWPDCEGPLGQPKSGPVCPAGVTAPVHSYPHDTSEGCCLNRAIVGGEIYRGSVFPLAGHYLYSDYPTSSFYWLQLGPDGRTAVASGQLAAVGTRLPVWMGVGPDGNVYWLDLGFSGNGQLRRLGYSGTTNQPPTITTAVATPTSGSAPLTVAFTGAASDPDGTAVTYAWDFGDGATSTAASPTHVYTTQGTYQARLQVSSGGATVSGNPIVITVGTPPTATITSPADGTTFAAGGSVTFQGTGFDPDTGTTLSGSALSWTVQFLHDDHAHPAATGTGSSLTLPIPRTGHDYAGNTRYLVRLTATDATGLSSSSSVTIWPRKVSVPVTSNAATTMTVDAVTQNLPFTIDTVEGFQHVVGVPATQCVGGVTWNFGSWSDGGALSHTVTVTPGLSLSATYVNTGTACAPVSTIGTLRYSLSNLRSAPVALQGASVPRGTPLYVFLDTTTTNFTRVEFWLDQPVSATPRQVETVAPYDFAGGGSGAGSTANAFSTSALALGSHTITVRATRANGTSEVQTATFTLR